MGIEPTYLAWKASVLPLNYTRIYNPFGQCPEPESNQRHEDFQSSALPTELSGQSLIMHPSHAQQLYFNALKYYCQEYLFIFYKKIAEVL